MYHRKVSQTVCILLLVLQSACVSTHAKQYRVKNSGSLFPRSSLTLFGIRGGAPSIKQKQHHQSSSFRSHDSATLQESSKDGFQGIQEKFQKNTTNVQTQSSVIYGGDDNDENQYKQAVTKTLLTVFAAGKNYIHIFEMTLFILFVIMTILNSNKNICLFSIYLLILCSYIWNSYHGNPWCFLWI